MKKPHNIIKIGEACQILGVHPNTLRRWENEGKIKPLVRSGGPTGTRYYNRFDLERMSTAKNTYLSHEQIVEMVGGSGDFGVVLGQPFYERNKVVEMLQELRDYVEAINS